MHSIHRPELFRTSLCIKGIVPLEVNNYRIISRQRPVINFCLYIFDFHFDNDWLNNFFLKRHDYPLNAIKSKKEKQIHIFY